MFITFKETVGDHKIKGGRKVETLVTRWLLAQHTDFHEQGTKKGLPTNRSKAPHLRQ
jgi:hypothetical protein